jgi:hypothetical protein
MSTTFTLKVDTVDDLLEVINPHDGAGFKLRCLIALRDRVIRESGFSVGSRAPLIDDVDIKRGSGWWYYRRSLQAGAVGSVREIHFDSRNGAMYVAWIPDVEWFTVMDEWRSRPGENSFMLGVDRFEPVDGG